jgi:hypothetical protein
MSTRTLPCSRAELRASTAALALLVASTLPGTALAQDATQETGAVSLSGDANASAQTTSAPPQAEVQQAAPRAAVGKWRILAGLHFGFGGELSTDVDTGFGLVTGNDPDLEPTIGLQAGVDYLLMEYFAIGGELRLSWWKPERNITPGSQSDPDRSMYVDINVKPRGRYTFSNIPLELYGTLPFGLSFAAISDDVPMDGGPGFNLGFGGGLTYFFTPRVGINTEILGVWHWFDGELDVGPDTDNRTAQFYWMLNAVFAI